MVNMYICTQVVRLRKINLQIGATFLSGSDVIRFLGTADCNKRKKEVEPCRKTRCSDPFWKLLASFGQNRKVKSVFWAAALWAKCCYSCGAPWAARSSPRRLASSFGTSSRRNSFNRQLRRVAGTPRKIWSTTWHHLRPQSECLRCREMFV